LAISNITGYAARAKARVGSNGDLLGVAEVLVGDEPTSSPGTARVTWDGNLADGLDSGWVSITFTALAAGGANSLQFAVIGASPNPATFALASAITLRTVKVRAAVDAANRRFAFQNLVIKFFHAAADTTAAQTVRVAPGSWPVADTMGLTDPADAEHVLTVSALRTDNQKVVVTADVRLISAETELPLPDGLFGDVFVFQ
jgi:hypothetical protein